MGKQFDSKKEAALTLKKFYSALDQKEPQKSNEIESESTYRGKYNLLLKRYQELDKVYRFQRDIIQTVSSGIITIDNQARITFMNRAALDMLKYDHLHIQHTPFQKLFADQEEGRKIEQALLNEDAVYHSQETHFITSDNEVVPIGFTTSRMRNKEQENAEGIVLVFRNISSLVNLRKQIERMDRLATLGELSAGIAHEIRNPLAGIKTSAQVLEESFSPGDFRSQLVSRIVKEIDRSNELLKRFFNFARPSKPRQNLHDVEMIVDGVYLLLAPRMKKNKIKFTTEFASDIPQVYIDVSQLEQVVLNLFINAIEAMDNGGELKVQTGLTEDKNDTAADTKPRSVIIRVQDSGKGIEPDRLEKIFNPFYTTKSDGVGLGLSISTRLLEENGGKIEVESAQGKGTVFSIYLPLMEEFMVKNTG